jgi:hypothetical protein
VGQLRLRVRTDRGAQDRPIGLIWSDMTMVRRYARSTPITELQHRPTPLAWLMSKKAI